MSSIIRPLICGLWDGAHLWVQWLPAPGCRIETRWRRSAAEPWSGWTGQTLRPRADGWLVVALHGSWQVQARAAADGVEWELAQEVVFVRSRCRFSISTDAPVRWPAGTEFSCVVDRAPCHWKLVEALDLPAGGTAEVEMVAALITGWSQLDRPGDFDLTGPGGLCVRNLEPSRDDVDPTGRDFTVIAPRPRDAPLKVTFRPGRKP